MLLFDRMTYILALLISTCLIFGQGLWGSAVKKIAPLGTHVGSVELLTKLVHSPKLWLGGLFYALGTVLYFLLLSRVKFFSVQLTMTGLAIIFSVAISYFLFKEPVSIANAIGIIFVLAGIFLVMR